MSNQPLNHSYYLSIIKRILKASFVGWITDKNTRSLMVKVAGKEHLLPLEGEEINHETYSHLIKNLVTKDEQL